MRLASDVDIYFMRLALEEAMKAAEMGEVPVGAVIVDAAGEVVARGCNLRETRHDVTAHAEMVALREANARLGRWRLEGCVLYVTLEPCPMCAGAIVQSRLDRLVYGAPDFRMGGCESLLNIPGQPRLNPRTRVTAGVLEEECRAVLQAFFRARR